MEARHITHPHHRPPGAREPGHRADQVAQGKADHSSHAPQQPSVQQSKEHRPRLGTARQGAGGRVARQAMKQRDQ